MNPYSKHTKYSSSMICIGGGYSLLRIAKRLTNTLIPTIFLLFTLIILILGCETKKDDIPISPVTQTFILTFDTQGGTEISQQTIKNGEKAQKPTNPTRDRYVFENWYQEKGLKNIFDFTKETITANTTVYAKWEKQKYTVTFDTDGGIPIASVKVEQGDKPTKPIVPTKLGYVFVNWYKDTAKIEIFDFGKETITKAITIYAKWDLDITVAISFTGIQALELTVSSAEDITINAIVRLANEPIPVWTDIKNKVGLLTRKIKANVSKRIFTAKHYDTNDNLKTNIGVMSTADFLQPQTAYKVYVFRDENIVKTLSFTTVAIPPASKFAPMRTGYSMRFAPNVLPFDAEVTYNVTSIGERKGLYELYGKESEVLLLPMYMDSGRPLKTGWRIINGTGTFISSCSGYSCLPNSGYAMTSESIYQSVTKDRYHKVLFGFQSFNKASKKDVGNISSIIDGTDGEPYIMLWLTDK